MPSQDITLLLYSVISSRGNQLSALSKHVYNFLMKIDDVTIQNLIRRIRELNSPNQELTLTLTILCQICIMVQICFCFRKVYLVIKRLSFNFNANFLFSLVGIQKLSKDGEWLQSTKLSLTPLTLRLTFFLVNGGILICSLILKLRCLTYSP